MAMKKEQEKTDHLGRAIGELPAYEPKRDLWDSIEEVLDDRVQLPQTDRWFWTKISSVAAVILVVVLTGLIRMNEESPVIRYSEEMSLEMNYEESGLMKDEVFVEFLGIKCEDLKEVCEGPEFRQLLEELNEIRDELLKLTTIINEAGYDLTLSKAKQKVEKDGKRIKEEIVTLLRG